MNGVPTGKAKPFRTVRRQSRERILIRALGEVLLANCLELIERKLASNRAAQPAERVSA
jgi:hypothetical protein